MNKYKKVMEFGAKFIARKPNFLTEYWSFQYVQIFEYVFLCLIIHNVLLDFGRTYLQSTSLFVDCDEIWMNIAEYCINYGWR